MTMRTNVSVLGLRTVHVVTLVAAIGWVASAGCGPMPAKRAQAPRSSSPPRGATTSAKDAPKRAAGVPAAPSRPSGATPPAASATPGAKFKSDPVADVCKYLATDGFVTGRYRPQYAGAPSFVAITPYVPLGGPAPRLSNACYSVEGTKDSPLVLRITANVYKEDGDDSGARRSFVDLVSRLHAAAVASPLPPDLATALGEARSLTITTGPCRVEAKRTDWPTGLGYDVEVTIR